MRDFLTSFFRQYRVFRAVFATSLLLGILYLLFATPLYEASGSLLVKFGNNADAGVGKSATDARITPMDRIRIVESNLEILQSHDLLKSVLLEIGLERVYPSFSDADDGLEKAIHKLQNSDLNVRSNIQSDVLEIVFLNKSPEVAAEFVRVLQDKFIHKQLEIFNKPQTEFLQEQVKLASEKLEKSQTKFREFKKKVGVSSIDDELSELQRQKTDAANISFQSMDDAEQKLAELLNKRAEMLATYRENSPAFITINQNINEAKRQIYEQKSAPTLATQNAKTNQRIEALEGLKNEYNDLARLVQIDEVNYKNYLAQLEDAGINQQLGDRKITEISIVDAPSVPLKLHSPRKILTLFSALLSGLMLGIGAVFLREALDERIYSPEQLSNRLQLPVIAAFPRKNEAEKLFNYLQNKFSEFPIPMIQLVSAYNGEGGEQLAQELADFGGDLVIIPSSGVLHNAATQYTEANGIVLVVQAERTRAPVLLEIMQQINAHGGNIIGVVLMERKFYIPKRLYKLFYHRKQNGNWIGFLRVIFRAYRRKIKCIYS